MENYRLMENIGEGTFGVVYKAIYKETGQFVAIKKIRSEPEGEGVPPTTLREVSLLKELDHPNIVQLREVVVDGTQVALVFEFLSTDLAKYLACIGSGKFMEPDMVKSFLYQINNAILYCHQRRILHRDLKPQNLLIHKGVIKLADFGLGRAIGVPIRRYTNEVVTLWYRAPEILLGSPRYSCPIDMWSIGCILAEMSTNKTLFQGDSEINQLSRIFRILRTPTEDIWPGISSFSSCTAIFPDWKTYELHKHIQNLDECGMDLLKKMLIYDPVARITAKQAKRHDYFRNVKLPAGIPDTP